MMNDSDIYYILDCVASILASPRWEAEVLSFVDEKCIIFDSEEENKLQFTDVHKEFVELVDTVLADRLIEVGINEDQFCEACLEYNKRCKKSTKILDNSIIDQIHAMADFEGFKVMMLKRNMELQIEAMEALQFIDGCCKELCKNLSEMKDKDGQHHERNEKGKDLKIDSCSIVKNHVVSKSLQVSESLVVDDLSERLTIEEMNETTEIQLQSNIHEQISNQVADERNEQISDSFRNLGTSKSEEENAINLDISNVDAVDSNKVHDENANRSDCVTGIRNEVQTIEAKVTNDITNIGNESNNEIIASIHAPGERDSKMQAVSKSSNGELTTVRIELDNNIGEIFENDNKLQKISSLDTTSTIICVDDHDEVKSNQISKPILTTNHIMTKKDVLDRHNKFKQEKQKRIALASVKQSSRKSREEHLKRQREMILKKRGEMRRAKALKESSEKKANFDGSSISTYNEVRKQRIDKSTGISLSSKMKYLVKD